MRSLRFLLVALTASLAVAVVSTPVAGASLTVKGFQTSKSAIDGTDLYTVSYRKRDIYGLPTSAVIWRQSILGGKRTRIASFRPYLGEVEELSAGGGRVAAGFQSQFRLRARTKVFALNRDGTGKKVLGSGNWRAESGADGAPKGCGTTVYLVNVTSSGSVLVSTASRTRDSRFCGRRPNSTRWSYDEIAADGSRRAVDSGGTGAGTVAKEDRWADVDVTGDFAVFSERQSLDVYVRQLTTGTTTGPFLVSPPPGGLGLFSVGVSLGPGGALVIDTGDEDHGVPVGERWTDVFLNPAAPNVAARSNRLRQAGFCGSRLIDVDFSGGSSTLREHDPRTLATIRTFGRLGEFSWIEACNATHVVVSRLTDRATVLRAVAIPG